MKTIYHPTLTGVSREVRESEASRWKAQGWRYTQPKPSDSTPSPETDDATESADSQD